MATQNQKAKLLTGLIDKYSLKRLRGLDRVAALIFYDIEKQKKYAMLTADEKAELFEWVVVLFEGRSHYEALLAYAANNREALQAHGIDNMWQFT